MCDENLLTIRASHLYHLHTIGIGTPNVESLVSNMKRLAEAHCVSISNLLNKEILPNVNKGYLNECSFTGLKPKDINSMDIVRVLEEKTCNNGLKYLTMNTWKECFNSLGMFRKIHAWCPICYEESLQSKQPIYEQLIWSLNCVEICKKHQVRLLQKCPYCNSEFRDYSYLSRVGYCNKCNSWLGLKEYEYGKILPINEESDNWIYDNVGQLLAIAPTLKEVNNAYFKRNIINIIKSSNLSLRKFANKVDVNFNTIKRWKCGKKPQLADVLAFSYKLGYSVCDILTKDIDTTNVSFNNKKIIVNRKSILKSKADMNEIKKTIDEAITTKMALSLRKLSIDFKIESSTIKKYLPEEVTKLKASNDEYFRKCKLAKMKLIKDTMKSLLDSGIFPSKTCLTNKLHKKVLINDDEMKVWLETLEELGCKSNDYNKYHGKS